MRLRARGGSEREQKKSEQETTMHVESHKGLGTLCADRVAERQTSRLGLGNYVWVHEERPNSGQGKVAGVALRSYRQCGQ